MEKVKKTTKFPAGIPFIIGNEAAERFSFYGMKALLTVFLITHFYNPENHPELIQTASAKANEKTHLFITLSYFLPIAGGLLADWFWGKYKTILILSVIYCLGNFLMAGFTDNQSMFMFGLMVVAVGAGGIKPCVSANLGDQFDKTDEQLISKAFSLFYFSINFGSFFSTLLIPLVIKYYGPAIAFGLPGVLMLIATIVFYMGRNKYIKIPPSGIRKENFIAINVYALLHRSKRRKGESLLDTALLKYSAEAVNGVKAVWQVLAVFAFIPIFWALYDQNSSEWVLQASHMNLQFAGITWMPQQIQAVNAILILVFIPAFTIYLYPLIEKTGIRFTAYKKIGTGLVLTLLSFVVIYFIQLHIDAGESPNIVWQLLAYVILTAGEVLISMTGLEFAYTQAPLTMKSTIMSFWLLTTALGNFAVTLINSNIASQGILSKLEGATYYLFFIDLIATFTLLFIAVSRRFKEN